MVAGSQREREWGDKFSGELGGVGRTRERATPSNDGGKTQPQAMLRMT